MLLITLAVAVLLVLAFAVLTRARRRPTAVPSEVQSMRLTLERRVREGADFRF